MRPLSLLAVATACTHLAAAPAPVPAAAVAPPSDVIIDDEGDATRLDPQAGDLLVVAEPEPEPEPVEDRMLVSLHSRWISVPNFILDLLFEPHTDFSNVSAGLGVEFGTPGEAMWVVEINWTPIIPTSGNWNTKGDPPESATNIDSGLHLISADITWRKYVTIARPVSWFIGGGIGIGALVGDINTQEVLPTCEQPVENCAHWRSATDEPLDLPTRILPIVHLTTGVQVDIADDAAIRLEAGFRDVFYVGLSAGMTL